MINFHFYLNAKIVNYCIFEGKGKALAIIDLKEINSEKTKRICQYLEELCLCESVLQRHLQS